jgi:hypothetical protein
LSESKHELGTSTGAELFSGGNSRDTNITDGRRMSLQETKSHALQLLADPEIRVLAISGKWGTGKSHLWQDIQKSSDDEAIESALNASLFGLTNVDQLKKKLIEAAIPAAEAHPTWLESAKRLASSSINVLESFHKGFGAINDLSLLIAPAILRNKLIVLDDVERKHEKLGIEEVLGFINQCTQQYGSRFLLILNSDQLADRSEWDILREKVIDQELRLLTSPDEAFEIARALVSSPYSDKISTISKKCGLTNIRILQRIIRTTNRILGERSLSEAILSRTIPSIVALSAISFQGIEDGPDLKFVLLANTPADFADRIARQKSEPDEESNRRAKWRLLLQEVGIGRCDEFDHLMVDFLESGQFDTSKVTSIIERFIRESDKTDARKRADDLLTKMFWNHRLTEEELIDEARGLLPISSLIDGYTLTNVVDALTPLTGGAAVGQELISSWLVAFRGRSSTEDLLDEDGFRRGRLHDDIKQEFERLKDSKRADTTVFDACIYIKRQSGWNTTQELVMRAATIQDFESTIRNLEIDDLKPFLIQMLDMRISRQNYDPHFGSAIDHFVQACRVIAHDPNSKRLGLLLRALFDDAKLGADLI